MAGLMDAVEKRKKGGLRKAADASHDPADFSASENTDQNVSVNDSPDAGISGSASDDTRDSVKADPRASAIASAPDDISVSSSDVVSDGRSAGNTSSGAAGSLARNSASRAASRSASSAASPTARSKAPKPRRRVGRPAGPDRTPLTVRVLAEIDAALTEAVEATGMSPQYIADDALRTWLVERGYLSPASTS